MPSGRNNYQDDEQVAEHADEQDETLEEGANDSIVARVVRWIAERVAVARAVDVQ